MTKKKSIELVGSDIPHTVNVACSGGVDSMFALSFLLLGKRDVTLAFFHHGSRTSEDALNFIKSTVLARFKDSNLKLIVGHISSDKPKGSSQEEFWRDERYKFLHNLKGPVVMAHHLDDCVESWIFGAIHGTPKTIPYRNRNVIRPFLLGRKEFMVRWCKRYSVPWIEDTSNDDTKYMRNKIRHNVIPEVLEINPGIHKVVARKVKETMTLEES